MVTKQTEPDVDAWREQEQRQRRTSRNRKIGALAVAAAIGIVAVVVVIRAADEGAGTQPGGQGTDTSGIPTAESIPTLPNFGTVEPGRYRFSSSGLDAPNRISIDVLDGYQSVGGAAVLKEGHSQTSVSTLVISDVYADTCRWQGSLLDRSEISSTEGVLDALANQEGLRVSSPTAVTVDGFTGTYMERRVPAGTDVSRCDMGELHVYSSPVWGDRWLESGQLQQLWILDVGGVPLVIDASVERGASPEIQAEVLQMVESIQIDRR